MALSGRRKRRTIEVYGQAGAALRPIDAGNTAKLLDDDRRDSSEGSEGHALCRGPARARNPDSGHLGGSRRQKQNDRAVGAGR
jgi:hypothetical protein